MCDFAIVHMQIRLAKSLDGLDILGLLEVG